MDPFVAAYLNGTVFFAAVASLIMGLVMWLMPDKFCIRYRLEAFFWTLLFGLWTFISRGKESQNSPISGAAANFTILIGIIVIAVVLMIILAKYSKFYDKRKIWIRVIIFVGFYIIVYFIAKNADFDSGFGMVRFLDKLNILGSQFMVPILLGLLIWVIVKRHKLLKGKAIKGCKCPQCNELRKENPEQNENSEAKEV